MADNVSLRPVYSGNGCKETFCTLPIKTPGKYVLSMVGIQENHCKPYDLLMYEGYGLTFQNAPGEEVLCCSREVRPDGSMCLIDAMPAFYIVVSEPNPAILLAAEAHYDDLNNDDAFSFWLEILPASSPSKRSQRLNLTPAVVKAVAAPGILDTVSAFVYDILETLVLKVSQLFGYM